MTQKLLNFSVWLWPAVLVRESFPHTKQKWVVLWSLELVQQQDTGCCKPSRKRACPHQKGENGARDVYWVNGWCNWSAVLRNHLTQFACLVLYHETPPPSPPSHLNVRILMTVTVAWLSAAPIGQSKVTCIFILTKQKRFCAYHYSNFPKRLHWTVWILKYMTFELLARFTLKNKNMPSCLCSCPPYGVHVTALRVIDANLEGVALLQHLYGRCQT